MMDPGLFASTAAIVGAVIVASGVGLRAWQGWLELKRMELTGRCSMPEASPSPAGRIEIADLKERVRRLEAIASGIEG